jgi:hypothetical protein
LLGKWLITTSFTSYDFTQNGIFIIFKQNQILLYGACNVYYTAYSLGSNGSLIGTSYTNTNSSSCATPVVDVQTMITKFSACTNLKISNANGQINL